jgi:type IV secretion system protein VirD4
MKPRALAYNAARARQLYPALPGRVIGLGLFIAAFGWYVGAPFTGTVFLATFLLWAAVTGWWFCREVLPAQSTAGVVVRKGDRQQRAKGVASVWDVMERASGAAMRRQVPILRSSLVDQPRKERSARSVAFLVATTGLGRLPGQRLWVGCRDATMRVGGPGTYKTMSLAAYGLAAPGALITTSTRFDLARHVHMARRVDPETGAERAVHILNPAGRSGIRSTVRWNILSGCTDYATAQRRAADLIPESRSAEGERWDRMARGYLPVLMHAAALAERNVQDVLRWVEQIGLEDREATRLPKIRREIGDILSVVPNGRHEDALLGAFFSLPDRTRGSVTGMMVPALAWIADEAAAEIGASPIGTTTLNIPDLITNRETLHIVGSDEQTGSFLAPLTSTVVAEIAWQARRLASFMPNERLDPFLTMLLDEAAVTVRLPLDRWTADMGGSGIAIHMSVQSLSQLEQTWGSAGAGTLKGNVGALIMFGGGKDADEMEEVSRLCGDRWRRSVNDDTKILARIAGIQRGEWQYLRVLTPADLMNLEPTQAAILVRNLGGVYVGRPPLVTEVQAKGHRQITLAELRTDLDQTATAPDVEEIPAEETADERELA